jgi:hypothetical protein
MTFDRRSFEEPLTLLVADKLIPDAAVRQALDIIDESFPFAPALALAESVHLHVNVEDVDAIPDLRQLPVEGVTETRTPADVKYTFPGGLNVVFASEATAQDELIEGAVEMDRPYVDHFGVDMREDSEEAQALFGTIPQLVEGTGWRHFHQDGPVMCCYTATSEKHWVFPPEGPVGPNRPIEFAFGDLKTFDTHVGCDYRPIDPDHPMAAQACATTAPPPPEAIFVFEERSCNAGSGDDLVDVFSAVYPAARVEAFDMAHPPALVPLPPALFMALGTEGSSCLPALVVNGTVYSQGWLPTTKEAVDFIRDQPLADPRLRPGDPNAASCCGPAGTSCC